MEAQGVGELERLVSFAGGLSVIYLLGARLEGQLVPNVAGRELGLLVLVLADQSDGRRQTPGDLELLVHRFGAGQNAFQGTRGAVTHGAIPGTCTFVRASFQRCKLRLG